MTPEQDKALIEKYPLLYGGHAKPITESLMAFGFECGTGWYQIIDELSAKIEPLNQEIKAYNEKAEGEESKKPFIMACQVKEKFGELRFYLDPMPVEYFDTVMKWVEEAEEKSKKTCEDCGKPGKTRAGGWIRVLCDECDK